MRVLTVAQARAIDRDAVDRLGIPSILLMENASRATADLARGLAAGQTRYVVLCGPGNNGGDGLAAARHLGRSCAVHLLVEPDRERSPDAWLQLQILRRAGHPVVVGETPDSAALAGVVWIDALFGTGLQRPLRGAAAEWIAIANAAAGPKLAVDIPSGLDGDSGEVLGTAFVADLTVTFAGIKQGMMVAAGPAHCGRIVVEGLGLPEEPDPLISADPDPSP
jgi:hydroxyethylthiazole kinase-like uncharacterized protein yjeF